MKIKKVTHNGHNLKKAFVILITWESWFECSQLFYQLPLSNNNKKMTYSLGLTNLLYLKLNSSSKMYF